MRVLVWMLMAACTAGVAEAQRVRIAGKVTDADGAPVAGVVVTVACAGNVPAGQAQKTAVDGVYGVTDLPAQSCRITATGQDQVAITVVELTGVTPGVAVAVPPLVLGASHAAGTAPAFQASGIRGVVDPGGYSAPANAAAASGVLSGMAEVRRSDAAGSRPSAANCAAFVSLRRAVAEHPRDLAAGRQLGETLLAAGDAAAALPYLAEAHRALPADAALTLKLARAQIDQQQFGLAKAELERLPASVQDAERHSLLAEADEGLGMFAEAALAYRSANHETPSVEYTFGEGYELMLTGKIPAALEAYVQGLKQFPGSVRLLTGKGAAQYLAGSSGAAVRTFLEAVRLAPAERAPYRFLAQTSLVTNDEAGQVQAVMRQHLQASPDEGEAYYLEALVLSRPGASEADRNEAEALLKRAVALEPGLAAAHLELGILEARRAEDAEAAVEFEQTLRLDPAQARVHFRLANAYRALGRKADAAQQMELFKASRAPEDESALSLSQFVSVLAHSGAGTGELSCDGTR